MEYRPSSVRVQPRLIIHGGAGNISRATMSPARRKAFREALHRIVSRTHAYMTTPTEKTTTAAEAGAQRLLLPSALAIATFAVVQLEDDPLFNSGHGAVFTRDGVNELEASVMVSRGVAKRGVGVMGLRHVRNPVLLARRMLEAGDADLAPPGPAHPGCAGAAPDVPSAQGHTQLFGATAEALAVRYGLPLVDPSYFYTQARWDEHVRGLAQEQARQGSASWTADAFWPQGTCGAVALDSDGVTVCCATSTGGLTNKLTGRVGDTPVIGAGSWAETWDETWDMTPTVGLSGSLRSLLAACLPPPLAPLVAASPWTALGATTTTTTTTTRSLAISGTGNGDSFLRVAAAHSVVAMARFRPLPAAAAVAAVAGPGGLLQQSAGPRWGHTGEGQGGFIGIESTVTQDAADGRICSVRTAIVADCNCGGMFRAWVDDAGEVQVRIFRDE